MLIPLRKRPAPIPAHARTLLDATPTPAILLTKEHRILAANAPYRAKYGEVGGFCYSALHDFGSPCDANGEACPLRTTIDTGRHQRVFHIQEGASGPHMVDVELEPIADPDTGEILCFIERLHDLPEPPQGAGPPLVGRSPAFLRALGLLQRGAPSEVPILLLGESGTGKEVAARALHRMSPRRSGPFVPIECSGLPETLFESELFGYEPGAFTGATKAKRGLVDVAQGGTLFLDEIGDVPLMFQVKLLRLLESSTYRRVGGTEPRRADFRLICATHRDLAAMVAAGTFRQDLFYRINAFPVILPPLRARAGDVAILCQELLKTRHPGKRLSPEALARLTAYDWPGNVRELRNTVERMVLLSDGDELSPTDLVTTPAPPPPRPAEPAPNFSVDTLLPLDTLEARYLRWAAEHTPDRSTLARALGISERTLYRKLSAAREPDPSDSPR